MTKVVVAMDSFKGSVSARAACEAVADGVRAACPGVDVDLCPMADGGEGTLQAILAGGGGRLERCRVTGPLPDREVDAAYGWFPERGEAVVEMAAASGLPLLEPAAYDPLSTTTYGTGQLLADALRRGCRRVLLAVGGSATVDGGVGAATALGWRFLDRAGRETAPGGGHLRDIVRIEPPRDRRWPPIEVLCDVTNPLCGERGAAAVFGPQKGATPAMVAQLEEGLQNLARRVRDQVGCDIASLEGGGAAGGLSAGAAAFFDARLVSGAERVMEATGLHARLADADWVLTGEGCFDRQSLDGKVVSGVTAAARRAGSRVAVIAGSVRLEPADYLPAGVEAALATRPEGMELEQALAEGATLLRAAGERWAGQFLAQG